MCKQTYAGSSVSGVWVRARVVKCSLLCKGMVLGQGMREGGGVGCERRGRGRGKGETRRPL